jgi:alkylation response protein AidB-like acyl-CoA dehydrogenase
MTASGAKSSRTCGGAGPVVGASFSTDAIRADRAHGRRAGAAGRVRSSSPPSCRALHPRPRHGRQGPGVLPEARRQRLVGHGPADAVRRARPETVDRLVVTEELLRWGAPVEGTTGRGSVRTGDRSSAPRQKQRFLPPICRGELSFSIGMAAWQRQRSRPVDEGRDGDGWVVSGRRSGRRGPTGTTG